MRLALPLLAALVSACSSGARPAAAPSTPTNPGGSAPGAPVVVPRTVVTPGSAADIDELFAQASERQAAGAAAEAATGFDRVYRLDSDGPRAAEAQWQDLTRALNLNDSILPSLGAVSLDDACASLPAAIVKPRYEFDKLLAEADAPVAKTAAAPAAVPPAPTPELRPE